MTQPIMDESALVFSEMFYGALGFALSVREAFDQGTLGIGIDARPGREVPELFARPGVDPMRVILVTARPHTPCDAALAVVRDELQRNLQTLAARITHTLTAVPSGDPVPQRPGEPRSAFDDRDRRWFTHAVSSEVAAGYAQFPLDTGGYDAHRLNLAECDAVRRGGAERAYTALAESEKRLAMYRTRLGTLTDGRQTSELRTRCAGLYSRQTANELAILWCQVLEGWAMLEPDEVQASLVGGMLAPQVLRGVHVDGRFAAGADGREFALNACAALHAVKASLLEEEMRLMPRPAPARRPSTPLEAIVAAGLAWVEGRPEESVAAFEQALAFADVPPDQRLYAETSLAYLRDPDRFGGVLGTYLLDVEPGGAAAEAGLHPGDVIVGYNAAPVTEPNVLSRLISHARGVPLVQVEVVRDGQRLIRFVKGGCSLSARGATLVVGDSFAV
jgi:hypothetical protein